MNFLTAELPAKTNVHTDVKFYEATFFMPKSSFRKRFLQFHPLREDRQNEFNTFSSIFQRKKKKK